MSNNAITVNQLRACLMMAAEQIKGEETGSTDTERMEQLCSRTDAEYSSQLHDLTGQLVTFVSMICARK